ncbi:tautomerase family protein [Rhodococcus sp. NPDC057014]|uniref:tautomerase family protein n=1 Tax=Rhodococcus sp. NPDC057014 TaxID=3346000 RepID=UPI0036301E04
MPMWTIYAPAGTYTAEDKQAIARTITDLYETYVKLPRFYVSVVIHEQPHGNIFMGGEPVDNFVRIWIDHVARNLDDSAFTFWLRKVDDALAPYIRDRGFNWEIHGDETPRAFWEINGMTPPPTGSEDEQRWARENRASELTGV